jgi:N-acetylglutamate synthase-like GNAT family acetyltransferase
MLHAGLAGELLTQVLAKAREVGLPEVWLWTKDQTATLYEKYGWVRKETAVYHGDNITIMQAVLSPAPPHQ